jgi:hypothetical protein
MSQNTPTNTDVPDPEVVPRAKHRQFAAECKLCCFLTRPPAKIGGHTRIVVDSLAKVLTTHPSGG